MSHKATHGVRLPWVSALHKSGIIQDDYSSRPSQHGRGEEGNDWNTDKIWMCKNNLGYLQYGVFMQLDFCVTVEQLWFINCEILFTLVENLFK